MHRHVRVILPVRVHWQHVPERLVQAHLLVLIRLVPERQRDLVRLLALVRNQEIDLQLLSDRLHRPEMGGRIKRLFLIETGIQTE